jgi:CO/xanthine dehydrogenase Mo-binding subunit
MNTRMTPEARAALESAGLSRREFLAGSGALIVAFSLADLAGTSAAPAAQIDTGAGSNLLDAWIAIGADGTVTAYTGKCDFGQGMFTAQTQLIAEELCVPVSRVKLVECDTAATPDQGVTSGQQSTPANFNHANLGLAGATAREALVKAASDRLGVPAGELVATNGTVAVKADPSRSVTYGDLIGGKKFSLQLSPSAKRKPAAEWTVLGKPVPRIDLPALVTARFQFVHNVRVPGMLHGRVVRPAAVGATLVGVDESSVAGLPGLVKVVVKKNFVGVVAEKPWQAVQAVRRLKATWTAGAGLPAQKDFYEQLRNQKPTRDTLSVNSRDVDQTLAAAASVVKATYIYPYQSHGPLAASCAVADVQGNRATVWSASQGVHPLKHSLALLLGLQPDNVRVVFVRGSGCYGINGADTVSFDAALMSAAVGKPVRVEFTRRDEMAWENYGMPFLIDQRAGVDAAGNVIAWDYEAWSAGLGGRPSYDRPGNLITGRLSGFEAAPLVPRSPAPDPTGPLDNNRNMVPSYLAGCAGGSCLGSGTIKSERVLSHRVASPFFTGPLRAPERLQNTFAHESFMDEIAAQVKVDPVAYRLRHLRDPRLIEVVRAATTAARWEPRPSPRPGAGRAGVVSGRGVACAVYEGTNGWVAMVVELDVNQDAGTIDVKRIVVAQDSGPISNPDGMKNQIEGSTLFCMSRALMEELTWDDQKVTSVDWRSYRTFPLGFRIPIIESILINQVDAEAAGAGETAGTVVAAAIGNAIFDATGARIRQVPFTPDRVKAALGLRPA